MVVPEPGRVGEHRLVSDYGAASLQHEKVPNVMHSQEAQMSMPKAARCFSKMNSLQGILADAVGGERA